MYNPDRPYAAELHTEDRCLKRRNACDILFDPIKKTGIGNHIASLRICVFHLA